MIAEVRKEPDQQRNIGNGWHTDHSYDEAPALGSMLYAREVPTTGGDTLFASMYAAYDALSDGLKATLEGLKAVHSSRHVFGPAAAARRGDLDGRIRNPELATQDAVHPVGPCHSKSGSSEGDGRVNISHGSAFASPPSISSRDHPARDLALSPLHPELPRRGGTACRAWARHL